MFLFSAEIIHFSAGDDGQQGRGEHQLLHGEDHPPLHGAHQVRHLVSVIKYETLELTCNYLSRVPVYHRRSLPFSSNK